MKRISIHHSKIYCFTILAIVICNFALFAQPGPPDTPNPIAYYSFDGNTNDGSGNGLHGIGYNLQDAANRTSTPAKAKRFNGSTSYVNIPYNALLKRYNSSFSISAWIYITSYSTSYQSILLSNRGSGPEGSALALSGALNGSNKGKVTFIISGGTTASQVFSTSIIPLNTWTYVSVTFKYNGANNNVVKIYVNGILETTSTTQPNILDPGTLPTIVGYDPLTSSPAAYHFNGIIDNLSIFNQEISAADISYYKQQMRSANNLEEEAMTSADFSMYPNPAVDNTTISAAQGSIIDHITIVNGLGNTVYNKAVNTESHVIPLQDLSSGLYTIVISSNGTLKSKKLVVN